jgi:catechol 2,3-dioxygenase-like lactoylglutathione lyase family enzyme
MRQSETGTHITGVGTVGIPVADQDRALEFYVGRLGFEKRMDMAYGQGQRWVEVAPRGAVTAVGLVRSAQGSATGIDTGIRFATDDAEADHATLLARSVDVDEILPYPVPMFTLRDPDGNRLYIVERPRDR